MIQKIKNGLKKRKVKVFLIFLLCSTLAWFVSKLSLIYINDAVFELQYVNVPPDKLLVHASHDRITAQLEGFGFQFLRFGAKTIEIDLSGLSGKEDFFLSKNDYRKQIEDQLSNTTKLLGVSSDTLFFDFERMLSKKVPVKANISLSFAQNYLLDGQLNVAPDSITITGPEAEVDSINKIQSEMVAINDLTEDFTKNVNLVISDELIHTRYSKKEIEIFGKVSKFSEVYVQVEVKAINVPEGTRIKLFPNTVAVLCKGSLPILKEAKPSDFELIVDYDKIKEGTSNKLSLVLQEKPEDLQSAVLEMMEVEFIIERR